MAMTTRLYIPVLILLSLAASLLAGCTSGTSEATPTLDPCSENNIADSVAALHRMTRSFDDTANLAANTPRDQISGPIAALQAIRRQAQDYNVASCLITLQGYQIAHMNAVINTLVSFMGGADPEMLNTGIEQARLQRAAYDAEYFRLLGVTPTPAPTQAATATP